MICSKICIYVKMKTKPLGRSTFIYVDKVKTKPEEILHLLVYKKYLKKTVKT